MLSAKVKPMGQVVQIVESEIQLVHGTLQGKQFKFASK